MFHRIIVLHCCDLQIEWYGTHGTQLWTVGQIWLHGQWSARSSHILCQKIWDGQLPSSSSRKLSSIAFNFHINKFTGTDLHSKTQKEEIDIRGHISPLNLFLHSVYECQMNLWIPSEISQMNTCEFIYHTFSVASMLACNNSFNFHFV